jgi:hypothetical protein
MTDLTMHGYCNDIHIINADRIPNCLIELHSLNYSDRTSLELLSSGAMRYIMDRQQFILRAPVVFGICPARLIPIKPSATCRAIKTGWILPARAPGRPGIADPRHLYQAIGIRAWIFGSGQFVAPDQK